MSAAARAGHIAQTSNVARAVADHRQRLLGQRRDDQFAGLAHRQRLQRLRIDDLEQEMILPAVQPGLNAMALAGHTRPHDFGQAVDVNRLEPEPNLEIAAHGVAPRFRPKQPDPQGRLL